jgi:hypothetical protein
MQKPHAHLCRGVRSKVQEVKRLVMQAIRIFILCNNTRGMVPQQEFCYFGSCHFHQLGEFPFGLAETKVLDFEEIAALARKRMYSVCLVSLCALARLLLGKLEWAILGRRFVAHFLSQQSPVQFHIFLPAYFMRGV